LAGDDTNGVVSAVTTWMVSCPRGRDGFVVVDGNSGGCCRRWWCQDGVGVGEGAGEGVGVGVGVGGAALAGDEGIAGVRQGR
jgi:hypothetical protein